MPSLRIGEQVSDGNLSKTFFIAWKRVQNTSSEPHDHRLQGSKKEQQRNDAFSDISKKGRLAMQSVIDFWQRIEHWLAVHAPHILEHFNPGASETQIVEAETMLGFALPEDFKTFYRIHNGGGSGLLAIEGMSQGLLPLHYVMQSQRPTYNEPAGFVTDPHRKYPPVQPVMWHNGWIEIAEDGGGNSLCLDMAPAAGGQVGQVFDYDHEDGPTWVIASSFGTVPYRLLCKDQWGTSEERCVGGICWLDVLLTGIDFEDSQKDRTALKL